MTPKGRTQPHTHHHQVKVGTRALLATTTHGLGNIETGATTETKVAGTSSPAGVMTDTSVVVIVDIKGRVRVPHPILVSEPPNLRARRGRTA